jgi:hypothetical protein
MSFIVVIKGPVANAGSILYLLSTKGTMVPSMAETTITLKSAVATVKLKIRESLKTRL